MPQVISAAYPQVIYSRRPECEPPGGAGFALQQVRRDVHRSAAFFCDSLL